MEKKFDLKKFLSNNAIIILIVLLALFVGSTTQNFFTVTNGKNLLLNVAPRFIIACGVSGCLITKGTDLSVYTQKQLDAIADEINNRPMRVLGYRTPAEAFADELLELQDQQGCCTSK